jgi:hypothetical protein
MIYIVTSSPAHLAAYGVQNCLTLAGLSAATAFFFWVIALWSSAPSRRDEVDEISS